MTQVHLPESAPTRPPTSQVRLRHIEKHRLHRVSSQSFVGPNPAQFLADPPPSGLWGRSLGLEGRRKDRTEFWPDSASNSSGLRDRRCNRRFLLRGGASFFGLGLICFPGFAQLELFQIEWPDVQATPPQTRTSPSRLVGSGLQGLPPIYDFERCFVVVCSCCYIRCQSGVLASRMRMVEGPLVLAPLRLGLR